MIGIENKISSKCACKGIRKCAVCSPIEVQNLQDITSDKKRFFYCPECKIFTNLKENDSERILSFLNDLNSFQCFCLDNCIDENLNLNGIFIINDFITTQEEEYLLKQINDSIWNESQSGRFKQDFGPKANFNKKKLKYNTFSGLPYYSKFIVDRINQQIDKIFRPVELCNLKYDRNRAACIDPHFDDIWLWGDRLVTINLLENTFLTLIPGSDIINDEYKNVEILIPLKRRSLLILSDEARYKWMHSIRNSHINSLRIAMTFRELSDFFVKDDIYNKLGKKIEDLALTYKGCAVGEIELALKKQTNIKPNWNEKICLNDNLLGIIRENLHYKNELEFDYEVIENDHKYLVVLLNQNHEKQFVTIKTSNKILKDLVNNFDEMNQIYKFNNIKKLSNFIDIDNNLFICCETYSNNCKKIELNKQNLIEIGKLIGKWKKISTQYLAYEKVIDIDDSKIENVYLINYNFDSFKENFFDYINKTNIDISLKTKAIATVLNLQRLMKNTQFENISTGVILGDFKYENLFLNTEKIEIENKTNFVNLDYSHFLTDLAICLCDFILNHSNKITCKEIALVILYGYESEVGKLEKTEIEFLHHILIYNLILESTKTSMNSYLSLIEQIYMDNKFFI